RMQVLEEYRRALEDGVGLEAMQKRYGKAVLESMLEREEKESESLRFIETVTRACPTCGVRIVKAYGCNHIRCTQCNSHFCYLCGELFGRADPLAHFRVAGTGCYLKLLEGVLGDQADPEEEDDLAARRPLAALLSDVGRSSQQLARSRELILNVLSTVPSPREARKFVDSVSGQETLRTQRQFEERQALLASSQAPPGLVAGEFLHAQAARAPTRTLALVCVEAPGSVKLLAQMQRLGVVPVVLPLGSGNYRAAVGRAHALADAVDGEGGRAVPVGGVFHAGGVAADAVAEAVARGIIPVVAPVAADEGQRLGVVGRCVEPLAEALAALERAGRLSVARLIYVGDGLGIASGGAARRLVNLEEDYGR
ncbi:hypothetical protein GGI06_005664, partial [Coemansia sp. S85]